MRIIVLTLIGCFSGFVQAQTIPDFTQGPFYSHIVVLKDTEQNTHTLQSDSVGASALSDKEQRRFELQMKAESLMQQAKFNQTGVQNRRALSASMETLTDNSARNELGDLFPVINGFGANLTPEAVEYLERLPEVEFIDENVPTYINGMQTNLPTWGLDRIDQNNLPLNDIYQYENDGTGVNVYILDTGILADHPDFQGRVVSGATDCHGHGTHVAGTVGSATYGVAKNTTLNSLKVFKCDASGYPSGYAIDSIKAMNWIAKNAIFPAVVNFSVGFKVIVPAFDKAVQEVTKAGAIVVVSAGNNYATDACTRSPGSIDDAIVVAASNERDEATDISNIGPCVDIFAPGHNITSLGVSRTPNLLGCKLLNMVDPPYNVVCTWPGTSMAAPHVAGVAALYLQKHPNATPAQVTDTILRAATPNVLVGDIGKGSPNLLLNSRVGHIVDIDQDSYSVILGEAVEITASGAHPNVPLSYSWNLGDGSSVRQTNVPNINHTYTSQGNYTVSLKATNSFGLKANDTAVVTVYDPVTIVTTIITPMLLN